MDDKPCKDCEWLELCQDSWLEVQETLNSVLSVCDGVVSSTLGLLAQTHPVQRERDYLRGQLDLAVSLLALVREVER